MQGSTCTLHVHFQSVDNNQWLCIGIDGIESSDKETGAHAGSTAVLDSTDIGTQLLSYLLIDGNTGGMAGHKTLTSRDASTVCVHILITVAQQTDGHHLTGIGRYGNLQRQIFR